MNGTLLLETFEEKVAVVSDCVHQLVVVCLNLNGRFKAVTRERTWKETDGCVIVKLPIS